MKICPYPANTLTKPCILAISACGLMGFVLPGWAEIRSDTSLLGSYNTFSSGQAGTIPVAMTAHGLAIANSNDYNSYTATRPPVMWQNGTTTEVTGSPANPNESWGNLRLTGVSDSGAVIGWTTHFSQGVNDGNRAFLLYNGLITQLNPLSTASDGKGGAIPVAINGANQVAGNSSLYSGTYYSGTRATLWTNGQAIDLGSLNPPSSVRARNATSSAVGINSAGQVAGTASYSRTDTSTPVNRAFLWTDGSMRNLGVLGTETNAATSSAAAINDRGQVAGTSTYYANTTSMGNRAFLWSEGTMINLGSLGTNIRGLGASTSVALNAAGQVAGNSDYYVNNVKQGQRAFLWTQGTMVNLGVLGGSSGSQSSTSAGLNATGQVVGQSTYTDASGVTQMRAFLYNSGTMYRLDQYAAAGWTFTSAKGISDDGLVFGDGVYNGQAQSYVFTPHPDWQGGSGNWSDASHWNYAGMGAFGFTPGASHKVVINPTQATTIQGPVNAQVKRLDIMGAAGQGVAFDLHGGDLSTTEGTTLGANATLTGSGRIGGVLTALSGSRIEVAEGQRQEVANASFEGTVHNDGEIRLSATARFSGEYGGAGSLTGEGRVVFQSGSVLAPGNSPALVTYDVQTDLAEGSTLRMELAGTTPGSGHDKIVFNGAVTLGGDLSVVWLDGYSGQAGDMFDLFDWNNGVSGQFANVLLPTLGNGLAWRTQDLYAGGHIEVMSTTMAAAPMPVAEPDTPVLMLAGLSVVGLLASRNRKSS